MIERRRRSGGDYLISQMSNAILHGAAAASVCLFLLCLRLIDILERAAERVSLYNNSKHEKQHTMTTHNPTNGSESRKKRRRRRTRKAKEDTRVDLFDVENCSRSSACLTDAGKHQKVLCCYFSALVSVLSGFFSGGGASERTNLIDFLECTEQRDLMCQAS
jgi:hypothetical protein